jgi:hypothetical protein
VIAERVSPAQLAVLRCLASYGERGASIWAIWVVAPIRNSRTWAVLMRTGLIEPAEGKRPGCYRVSERGRVALLRAAQREGGD